MQMIIIIIDNGYHYHLYSVNLIIQMCIKILIIFYLFSASLLFSHDKKKSLKSHEHGLGTLSISQDENILLFEFEAPGFDIVGFEYVAKKESDKKKIKDALSILSDYKNIILPSGSADCELINSSANIIYEGNHSEFLSSYKFYCNKVSDLKIIYIKYFNKFQNCVKTNIKIVGKNKKSFYVINKSKKIINVKKHF